MLVFDEKTGVYVKKELQNIQSYTVQELVRLPSHDNTGQSLAEKEKPVRPQPKHLKMRFHPVGSGNLGPETIGSSSESEEETTTRVQQKEHKRKSEDQSEKKSKKKKEKHASSPVPADKKGRKEKMKRKTEK